MIDDLETRVLDIYLAHEQLGQLIIDLFQDITGQPGGGGNQMDIEIRDLRPDDEASLQLYPRMTTLADVLKVWKLTIDDSHGWDATPVGEYCYKLVAIEVRTGYAGVLVRVLGEDGNAISYPVGVYENWSTAPVFTPTPRPPYFDRAVAGPTEPNGVVGFPYSGGGMIAAGTAGPFSVWASADPLGGPVQFSTCVKGLGWVTNTVHFTPGAVIQKVKKLGTTPPPEPPPPGTATYRITGTIAGSIPVDLIVTPV